MIKRNSASTIVLASGLALAVSFALGGCATDNSVPVQDDAVNGNEIELDLEFGDGFEDNWADLPKDWPAGIPLVSEQITGSNYASTPDGEEWTVDILPEDLDAEFADARAQLTSAAFIEENWDGTEGTFRSDTHQIVLSIAVGDFGDDVIRYLVTHA